MFNEIGNWHFVWKKNWIQRILVKRQIQWNSYNVLALIQKKIKLKLYTYIGNHLFNSAYSPIDRV